MENSSKRSFFEEHVKYVMARDWEGMVKNTYTEDAVLIHNFPFFDTEPPYIVKGREAIVKENVVIFEKQGKVELLGKPTGFYEGDDFICFQLMIKSSNTGKWVEHNLWNFRDGKICQQFTFGFHLE